MAGVAVVLIACCFASFVLPMDTLYGPFVGAAIEGRNCVGLTSSTSCSSFKIVCKLAYGETNSLDVVVSYVRLRRSRNLIDGNLVGWRLELMLRSKSRSPSNLNENFETVLLVGGATANVYSDVGLVRFGEPNGTIRLISSSDRVGSISDS